MYNSSRKIENKSLLVLRKDLDIFLSHNQYVYCGILKRKIFLNKLPDAIMRRKSTRKKRLQCFAIACDIIRYAKIYKIKNSVCQQKEIEICGFSAEGIKVCVHLREETTMHKNRQLFFVSCFSAQK